MSPPHQKDFVFNFNPLHPLPIRKFFNAFIVRRYKADYIVNNVDTNITSGSSFNQGYSIITFTDIGNDEWQVTIIGK
jgi:hypothetical protein